MLNILENIGGFGILSHTKIHPTLIPKVAIIWDSEQNKGYMKIYADLTLDVPKYYGYIGCEMIEKDTGNVVKSQGGFQQITRPGQTVQFVLDEKELENVSDYQTAKNLYDTLNIEQLKNKYKVHCYGSFTRLGLYKRFETETDNWIKVIITL